MTSHRRRRQGLAMAVVLVVMLILVLIGSTVASLALNGLQVARAADERLVLLEAADGGLGQLANKLFTTPGYALAESGQLATHWPDTNYWWTFSKTGSDPWCVDNTAGTAAVTGPTMPRASAPISVPARTALLVASAAIGGQAQGNHRVRVACLITAELTSYALATDGEIVLDNVDGSGLPAVLRSNRTTGDDKDPNVEVRGSLEGDAHSRNALGSIKSSSGSLHYSQPKVPLPDLPIALMVASQSTAGVSPGGTHPYGGPATYQFPAGSTVKNTGSVLKVGTVTLVVPPEGANVYLGGDATFTSVELPANLNFFIDGDLVANGQLDSSGPNLIVANGTMTINGASTSNLTLLAESDVSLNGATDYNGFIYVHDGDFQMNGAGDYQGAAIIRKDDDGAGDVAGKNLDFHFDPRVVPDLNPFNVTLGSRPLVLSWWIWE